MNFVHTKSNTDTTRNRPVLLLTQIIPGFFR